MSDEAVYRTASATPGLLKSPHKSSLFRRESILKFPWGVSTFMGCYGGLKNMGSSDSDTSMTRFQSIHI